MTQTEASSRLAMTPERLEAVVQQHLQWLQSEGRDGRRANFSGESLAGHSLRGLCLANANFRGALLTGVDFSQAELAQANFRGGLLDGANFSRSVARQVYLDEVSAVGADFSHAVMVGASAKGADLPRSGWRFSKS